MRHSVAPLSLPCLQDDEEEPLNRREQARRDRQEARAAADAARQAKDSKISAYRDKQERKEKEREERERAQVSKGSGWVLGLPRWLGFCCAVGRCLLDVIGRAAVGLHF